MANENENELQATALPVTIHAQYIRDLSFENPNAQINVRGNQNNPTINVNIGMDARKLDDANTPNLYEVALTINAEATRDNGTVFIAELVYGVTVSVGDVVPEEQHHPLLLIEIPRISFPFARQIMATVTSQGGYPPLLLNPVDFHALYMDRFADDIKAAQEAAAGEAN